MPWTIQDVEKHKKGLTKPQKEKWVVVANSVRKSCMAKGESEKVCDVKAIKAANVKAVMSNDVEAIVNFDSTIKTSDLKSLETETTDEGLLIKSLPVFKAGVYRDIIYSEDYIDRNFIGQFREDDDVPVQADHSSSVFATLGWVKSLKRKSKMMYADFLLSDDNAIARWKKGLLKKFSISVDTINDKVREISIVAFPYVKSARVHNDVDVNENEDNLNINATEINGSYFVTIEGEQFEAKKNEENLWFFFPISRRDKDGEIVQEESINITDEDIDNIDIKEDIASDDDYGVDEEGESFAQEDFAKWSAKYKNSLPDSSFLLVKRPVRDKNRDRALPIKDSSGKFSRSHVQNALSRIDQVKDFSSDSITTAKKRLTRISNKLGVQIESKHSEDNVMKIEDLKKIDLSKLTGEGSELFKEALEQIGTIEKARDEAVSKLSAAEKLNEKYVAEAKESKINEALSKLKTEGKIVPAQEESIKAFMKTLSADKIDNFEKVLSDGKVAIDLSETGLGEGEDSTSNKDTLDIDKLSAVDINAIAEKLASEHSVDFHTALDWCYDDGKVNKAGKLIE